MFKCGCAPYNAQTQKNIRLPQPVNAITRINSQALAQSKNKVKSKVVVNNTRKTGGSRGGDDKPE